MYVESASKLDVIEKIAELILQDPSISVREVARRLGYAEEKTIYYWLSKRGFRGIRPFKRAVLTGQFRGMARSPEPVRRTARLPIANRLSPGGDPLYTGATLPVGLDRGRGLYALQYTGPADLGVLSGDYLVIGPLDLDEAEMVVVQTDDQDVELRHVLRPSTSHLLFDYRRRQLDAGSVPRGTVLQVVRVLRPAVP